MRSDVQATGGTLGTAAFARFRALVEESLLGFLSPDVCPIPAPLRDAMEYALTSGGKRIRPVVLLSAGAAVGGEEKDLLPFACSVEYVHTYSLIHDDLPAMDDDDYRRGRPTCHKVFGEAVAILAGDALLTEAFRVMGESPLAGRDPAKAVRASALLARAAGASGMAGGQMMDLAPPAGEGVSAIEEIDLRKTAALLSASAAMGGILGGGSGSQVESLSRYGRALGLLFQITDDILDETGSFEEMGKTVAKDRARGKLTYPAVRGMAEAGARAESLRGEALQALSPFGGEAETLRDIVRIVATRRS
ncbi:MAG TPA: polyprenyl synthetase [Deltaproteobacteria bacterium]|nr:polyprenyl synthetase [Deltaproteobacteria bacterium]